MNTNSIDQVFLEAVQCRHLLKLKTNDPEFNDVIVKPYWISNNDRGNGPEYKKIPLQPVLWSGVQKAGLNGDLYWSTNRNFLLAEILEYKIVDEEDLTSRKIPHKIYRDFEGHPAQATLLAWDMALRKKWSEAASLFDFDPAPFIAKDKRLGEIADEVKGWF